MATYLIDFENVRSDGLKGINWLSENDIVVIFYSNNADTLTFEAMDLILNSNATIRKFKIARGGKNALDFQLATYLGFLIHENKNPYFYIISKDNGFHYVIDFWKRTYRYEGYVFCCGSISEAYSKQKRFDSYSQSEKAAIIEELNQEELDKEDLEEEASNQLDTSSVNDISKETLFSNDLSFPVVPLVDLPSPTLQKKEQEFTDYGQYNLSFSSDPSTLETKTLASETAICEELVPPEPKNAKKETDPKKSLSKKKSNTKKSTTLEKGNKSSTVPKSKKTNPGELDSDQLLPLSSPIVQKSIVLTGELCNESQAQVAASHLIHSSGKQDFYRKMTAYFGQKHGIAVYNSLRSEYTNLRKSEI